MATGELSSLEKSAAIKWTSLHAQEVPVICSVCKLSLKFATKFVQMCQKTSDMRKRLGNLARFTECQEPEFLCNKVIKSIKNLLDWVDLALEQLDVGGEDSHEEDIIVEAFNADSDGSYGTSIEKVEVEEIKVEIDRPDSNAKDANACVCSECGLQLDNLVKLRRHLRRTHDIEQTQKFVCEQCGNDFPSKIR